MQVLRYAAAAATAFALCLAGITGMARAAGKWPDGLAYASGGTGTILHMQGELLRQQSGGRFLHVPYKGDTPALQDTLADKLGITVAGGSPQDLDTLRRTDYAKWGDLIRKAGIQP